MCYDGTCLKTLHIQGRFNTIVRYMERGGLFGGSGKNVRGEAGGQMPGSVFRVVGVHARFAPDDRDQVASPDREACHQQASHQGPTRNVHQVEP